MLVNVTASNFFINFISFPPSPGDIFKIKLQLVPTGKSYFIFRLPSDPVTEKFYSERVKLIKYVFGQKMSLLAPAGEDINKKKRIPSFPFRNLRFEFKLVISLRSRNSSVVPSYPPGLNLHMYRTIRS